MPEPLRFDLIVVGSGAAGLSAALRAAELGARVAVVTAGPLLAGSSPRAQGGVAAAVGADDAPALHAADTLAVGAGLNDASAVDVLTREGSRSVRQLWDDGMPFEGDVAVAPATTNVNAITHCLAARPSNGDAHGAGVADVHVAMAIAEHVGQHDYRRPAADGGVQKTMDR